MIYFIKVRKLFKIGFTFYAHQKVEKFRSAMLSNHIDIDISESKEDSAVFKLGYDLARKSQNRVYVYQAYLVYVYNPSRLHSPTLTRTFDNINSVNTKVSLFGNLKKHLHGTENNVF